MWTQNARLDALDDAMLVDNTPFSSPGGYDALENAYSPSEFRNNLLDDGSQRKSDGHQERQCMTCGEWIDLGKVDTGENGLVNHEGKRRCLAKVKSNKLV